MKTLPKKYEIPGIRDIPIGDQGDLNSSVGFGVTQLLKADAAFLYKGIMHYYEEKSSRRITKRKR
jgi:hypothetical protein